MRRFHDPHGDEIAAQCLDLRNRQAERLSCGCERVVTQLRCPADRVGLPQFVAIEQATHADCLYLHAG